MEKNIKLTGSRILVDIYEENPYEMNETENGFKMTKGEFENPDTGNIDKKNPGVLCGKVVVTGPDCKSVTEGCDVFIPMNASRVLVINDKSYVSTFEENVLVIFE